MDARIPEPTGLAAFWDLAPKKKVRVLLGEEQTWRPVFWIEVAKDASVYLSARYEDIRVALEGEKAPDATSSTTIRYEEAKPIPDRSALRGGRVSFHASGVVHLGRKRLVRPPLQNLPRQQMLCMILFERVDRFPATTTLRTRDVGLSYTVEAEYPLFAKVFAAPLDRADVIPARDMERQAHLVFDCAEASLSVRVVIGHGPKGPWPPHSYIVVPTPDSTGRGSTRPPGRHR